ncbi:MAG: hypothetical protein ACYSTF_03225, partial [Planctomycetota bacterium]
MMAAEYHVEVCKTLAERFRSARLYRPMRVRRYDAGSELVYDMKAVEGTAAGRVHLVIEKFVGGGFAGQVYKVKVTQIEGGSKAIGGIEPGGVYAMKILIPPSRLSRLFRNMLYWIGFQGAFALEVNPAAVRAGALWQKFIRRAAKIRLGGEAAVVDIHATFVDQTLGSCGELREWVEGRTWRLEVDDNLDSLKRWKRGKQVDAERLGSPEYRAKRQFMAEFVKLLHEVGGNELARQYEWWTCKSQPNCLKREGTDEDPSAGPVAVDLHEGTDEDPSAGMVAVDLREGSDEDASAGLVAVDLHEGTDEDPSAGLVAVDLREGTDEDPSAGLVAVDFRAGLALLPFLPMSPGDFKLIVKGLMRGSLVQFDRGDIAKLEAFVQAHGSEFGDMSEMLAELKAAEQRYRNSALDVTHNHIRVFHSRELWATMMDSAV